MEARPLERTKIRANAEESSVSCSQKHNLAVFLHYNGIIVVHFNGIIVVEDFDDVRIVRNCNDNRIVGQYGKSKNLRGGDRK